MLAGKQKDERSAGVSREKGRGQEIRAVPRERNKHHVDQELPIARTAEQAHARSAEAEELLPGRRATFPAERARGDAVSGNRGDGIEIDIGCVDGT